MTLDFKVKIDQKVIEKMAWFGNYYKQEIGAFIIGKVTENEIIVNDLIFPKQDVDSGIVEIAGKDLVALRQEYGDICINIIGEWHSHNTMGCFWSGTDDKLIEQYSQSKEVSIFIVSSRNDNLIRVELTKPFKISIDKLDYEVLINENDNLSKELESIIKEKVREKPAVVYQYENKSNKQKTIPQFDGEIKYFHKFNSVKINDVSLFILESLESDFQFKKYRYETEKGQDDLFYSVLFSFKNKKEAIAFIKFVKKWLNEKQAEKEEIEETQEIEEIKAYNDGYCNYEEEDYNNYYDDFTKTNKHLNREYNNYF